MKPFLAAAAAIAFWLALPLVLFGGEAFDPARLAAARPPALLLAALALGAAATALAFLLIAADR